MTNDCPYCNNPLRNFNDEDEGINMRIDEMSDGRRVIAVDPPYAWSIPINFCPFCGRKLEKVKTDAD